MVELVEIGQRVQTPNGPGTVLANELQGDLSVVVQLDVAPAGLLGGRDRRYAVDELQAILA